MAHAPRFDAALDAIFAGLQPHERTCRVTGERFTVSGEDIEMYRLLRVPPPTTSPWYRNLRRAAFFPFRLRQSFCAKKHRMILASTSSA